jgi:hypothetical protein
MGRLELDGLLARDRRALHLVRIGGSLLLLL